MNTGIQFRRKVVFFVYLNLNNILFRLNRRPKIHAVAHEKKSVLLHRVPNNLFTGINQIFALLFCWIDMMQTWLTREINKYL